MFNLKSILLFAFVIVFSNSVSSQYNYKILIDINQIWKDELPLTNALKADGIWSIPGNSAGNKGRDIPISEWQNGFNRMGPGWICTEDYWQNFPGKNYDLTKDIVKEDSIKMVCVYAEPTIANDIHTTTVVNDNVIADVFQKTGKKIIVLARSYSGNWVTELTRAMNNENVGGVCFEQKPDIVKYEQFKILKGFREVLEKGRKLFILLPPNFTADSDNYTKDVKSVFEYIEENDAELLKNPNFNFVPNCYNRLKDKETTFYGGENSVEGVLKYLNSKREESHNTGFDNLDAFKLGIKSYVSRKQLHVIYSRESLLKLEIFDITGRCNKAYELTAKSSNISLSELENGIYILRYTDNMQKVFQQKILIN